MCDLKFIVNKLFSDGKYHMTPDGELHVLNVSPQDGHSRFQCRTLHTLTGTTQLSKTPARIIVTGKIFQYHSSKEQEGQYLGL